MVRVSDLRESARSTIGSGLAHGWLDARMDDLGWTRLQLRDTRNRAKSVGAVGSFAVKFIAVPTAPGLEVERVNLNTRKLQGGSGIRAC